MAQVAVYPRALTEAEFNRALQQEKLAKVVFRPMAGADARYAPLLAQTQAAVTAARAPRDRTLKQLLGAVTQAGHHVDREAALLPLLSTVQRLATGRDANVQRAFVRAHPEFQFLENDRIGLAFFTPRPGATVLCSLFDLYAGRETFGESARAVVAGL